VFEAELKDKFKQIFKVKKVTYDAPSDAREQECLFIEIESSKNVIKDTRAKAMVTGNAMMNAKGDKLPFGFFSKAIKQADPALTKDLFFFDIEKNTLRFQDLIQRGFSFVYFFDSQYDPDVSTIENVTITSEE
jgi:hypothetical protein